VATFSFLPPPGRGLFLFFPYSRSPRRPLEVVQNFCIILLFPFHLNRPSFTLLFLSCASTLLPTPIESTLGGWVGVWWAGLFTFPNPLFLSSNAFRFPVPNLFPPSLPFSREFTSVLSIKAVFPEDPPLRALLFSCSDSHLSPFRTFFFFLN